MPRWGYIDILARRKRRGSQIGDVSAKDCAAQRETSVIAVVVVMTPGENNRKTCKSMRVLCF